MPKISVRVGQIKCSQNTINPVFKNGPHHGSTIHDLMDDLRENRVRPTQLDVVVILHEGQYWCVDGHRRMLAIRGTHSDNYTFRVELTDNAFGWKRKCTNLPGGHWVEPTTREERRREREESDDGYDNNNGYSDDDGYY